jgi:CxxC motif-containing protein (DUF1111 family)
MQWTIRKTTFVFIAATGVCILLLTQWQTHSQTSPESPCKVKKLATPLSFAPKPAFFAGCDEFMEVETIDDGLGPVFNGKSCAECHAVPSVGGSEPNVGVARETRIGGLHGDQLVRSGGPLLQQRAISLPGCNLKGEVVPGDAIFVSLRNSPPLFGAGLMEAIPDATILEIANGNNGKPNRVFNPDTERTELGRFGWKAQVATLHQFAGDAYLNEMGITNPSFRQENLPQGQQPMPAGCDTVGDPEDNGEGVTAFTNFMRFLAPLRTDPMPVSVPQVFSDAKCDSCHVPVMETGGDTPGIPAGIKVNLFSDLLLHHMGAGLADGIRQGEAEEDEFRTAPLWGLSHRDRFLHDGKSNKIEDAILRHGGQAQQARDKFVALPQAERDALLAFLNSL